MTTFADVLAARLRTDPGQPLVTFYDHGTGERVELSVTTYANWVAKVAGLLVDECDLERGQRIRLDLPAHWLGTVFLGAAWTVGLVVTTDDSPDAVVCGPDSVERWAGSASATPVLACSLLPLGVRFATPLPPGVRDVGVDVWGQPDSFIPWDPPGSGDPATDDLTQGELMEAAAAGSLLTDGGRLLTVANPASPPGIATFTEPLAHRGSLVLVAHPDPSRLEETAAAERATHRG
ncbi:TIGR03089 family protein [Nocardioides gansuensis]|uniref:TIGR03089 family protein n=1 Tax=Nocardioides gansuensis TaxID=2138300 RepID=A0A2T8FBK6_9ACTN|nr:TIGR03089 family protein [Nocardioides gansuensis]PVG83090.1 TIGR03089 family protein [Nocardioides gansuensis]